MFSYSSYSPLTLDMPTITSNSLPISPPTTVEQMREQFRDIARRTAQIEDTINANEIHGDLRLRIQRIKSILGETSHAADLIEPSKGFARKDHHRLAIFDECGEEISEIQSERGASPALSNTQSLYETIRMANKTPFWNDESQVYQVGFFARVVNE